MINARNQHETTAEDLPQVNNGAALDKEANNKAVKDTEIGLPANA